MTADEKLVNAQLLSSAPAWRSDIEGVRGIAVLLVVLYHAGVPGFTGGYIGVDIFFVLSGYLITGLLYAEATQTGRVDLPRFYARRARRLLPAAALLLVGVMLFALIFYSPLEQVEIARTGVATSLYLSNLYFGASATDYLAAEADTNPLLHTWSLAVEEQFYLGWPLLLLLLMGPMALRGRRTAGLPATMLRRRWIAGAIAVSGAAFLLTWFLMDSGRTHWAFFGSPPRAWEFAVGGLAALCPRLGIAEGSRSWLARWSPLLGQSVAWLGLGLVLLAGIGFDAHTSFPGWYAVLPVIGCVWLLRAGEHGAKNRLTTALSWRPLRELGRLSYSFYLWHWPVLVFAHGLHTMHSDDKLSLTARLLLLLVALLLAELSYRLVENPIRRSRRLGQRTAPGIALLGGVTLFSLVVAGGWHRMATEQMATPSQRYYQAARDDVADLYARGCHVGFSATVPVDCSDGPLDAPFTVALFGDSHAAQWAPALQKIAAARGWRIAYFTKSACAGLGAEAFSEQLGRAYFECSEWRESTLRRLQIMQPDLVVSSASTGQQLALKNWHQATESTYRELAAAAKTVLILKDSPRPLNDVPLCLSRNAWHREIGLLQGSAPCDFVPTKDEQRKIFLAQGEVAALFSNVKVVDLTEVLCPSGQCRAEGAGQVMYRDWHHLTASFVATKADAIAEQIDAHLVTTARSPVARSSVSN